MVTNDAIVTARPSRRPARDLIAAVLENMRSNLEPLKYTTLAPGRYVVYLHPSEFARLEGIVPILREETIRALSEELSRMNAPSRLRRYGARVFGQTPRVQTPTGEWQIEFLPDPDGELAEGDILIDSELLLPAQPELGVGERTRRITTSHAGEKTQSRTPIPPIPRARLEYEDRSGRHVFDITADAVVVGRGGTDHRVDVEVASSVDVSREHIRIRRDPQTNGFFLTDLSTLGTTLNGRHVPRGWEELNGARRETGAETALPDRARIGLAETVFLEFTVIPA